MTVNGNNVRQLFAVRAEVKIYDIITFIVTVLWLDHDEDNCSKQLGISSEKR